MKEIEIKIKQAINERDSIKYLINELQTKLQVKEAEKRLVDTFIDQLNDLKSKLEKENEKN